MKEFKIWKAEFPNGYTFNVRAKTRKEAIELLPTFHLSLSALKSLHLSKDPKDSKYIQYGSQNTDSKIDFNLYDKNKYDYLKNEEIQDKNLESIKRLISKKLDNEHKISLRDWLISQIDKDG